MKPHRGRARWPAAALPLAVPLLWVFGACSVPPSDSRYVQTSLPDSATFPPVAQLLELRCGALDCHGTRYRNLRIYGTGGLRWSPDDRPFIPLCDTADEIAQDFLSVVALEPETMSTIVSGGDPSMLTMVRKARGTEAHKGGQIWTEGDDSDTCLTSWLTARPDAGADAAVCGRAITSMLPNGSSNPLAQCLSSP